MHKECVLLTRAFEAENQTARYAPLGLLGNPFFGSSGYEFTVEGCEIISESNKLLRAIVASRDEEKPRPIWVVKSTAFPASFPLAAESRVEETISNDTELNILHAYVPLFAMKSGAVRSALHLLGERLTFHDFDLMIAAYVDKVLATPDTELASYGVMGPEALEEFANAFGADRREAITQAFGSLEDERKEEFAEVADMRAMRLSGDGAELNPEEGDEIDSTLGDAPGTGIIVAAESEGAEDSRPYAAVADYIIEYTREHLSAVIARALRVYVDRGLIAAGNEFDITKAPRKTFAAIVQFARCRYSQVVLMWDGFTNWGEIERELRSKIVGILSEMRWSVDGLAVPVFLVEAGAAPELEDSFASSTKLDWDFPGLLELGENPEAVTLSIVDRWLANAAIPGVTPLTVADPGIAALVDAADGSMHRFIRLGQEAIEHAADRGAVSIDEAAVASAIEVADAFVPSTDEPV